MNIEEIKVRSEKEKEYIEKYIEQKFLNGADTDAVSYKENSEVQLTDGTSLLEIKTKDPSDKEKLLVVLSDSVIDYARKKFWEV